MVVALEKPLKRELLIDGRAYVLTISPQSLKLVVKGRRKGYELPWSDLVSGEAALATALSASLGQFEPRAGRAAKTPGTKRRAHR
jgi:hypothetical protein